MRVKSLDQVKLSDGIYLVVTKSAKAQETMESVYLREKGDSVWVGGKMIIKIGETVDMRDLICFDCYERDYCDELCDHFWEQREVILQEMLSSDKVVYDEMFDVLVVSIDNKVKQIEFLENSK